MSRTLADFPPDRFVIHAYCMCADRARVDTMAPPAELEIDTLRGRLRCQVPTAARSQHPNPLDGSGWIQAFGWSGGLGGYRPQAVLPEVLVERLLLTMQRYII
jgi:hypothetical protein